MCIAINFYVSKANEEIKRFSDSPNYYQSFLRTSSKLYKYGFVEQVLIHAQKPDAVACAEYNTWGDNYMNRYIKRGSKGIAIVSEISGKPRMRYVFDFADTGARNEKAKTPFFWKVTDETKRVIADNIGDNNAELTDAILDKAHKLAKEYSSEYVDDLEEKSAGSFLEELDKLNLETRFEKLLEASIGYSLMTRCGLETSDYYDEDDFRGIYEFNTPETMCALGSAVSDLSEQVLREIERTLRNFERNKNHENSVAENNIGERNNVHTGREHGNISAGLDSAAVEGNRQIRLDEIELPQEEPQSDISGAFAVGNPEQTAVGDGTGGTKEIKRDNTGYEKGIGSDRAAESAKPDEVGRSDEHDTSRSGRDNSERTDLQMNNEAGLEESPAFVMNEKIHSENFRITDDNLGTGGAKTKFNANFEAIRTLKKIENESREAAPEEQEILSRYVGWGSLPQAFDENNKEWADEFSKLKSLLTPEKYKDARASTQNAHYTSPTVIEAIYSAVSNLGFKNGNILEPSMGTGNFFGKMPDEMRGSKLYGVELDSVTGRIAKKLYPDADIQITGFEKTEFPDNFFDIAIGNVPFGSYKLFEKRYNKLNLNIHDHFFAKSLDKIRAGGVIAFVTSKGTLDKANPEFRKYLAQRAELLGAVRLPNNAFKANAGTEVTSDIIFLQKRDKILDIEPDWVNLGETPEGVPVNKYFQLHPEMILGEMKKGVQFSLYGNPDETACVAIDGADLKEQLSKAVQNIRGKIPEIEAPEIAEGKAVKSIPADIIAIHIINLTHI